jgi:hypothetical protein
MAYLRFCHMGHYFMEPGDYHNAPIRKALRFIRSVELIEGWKRGSTIDFGGHSARAGQILTRTLHTYNSASMSKFAQGIPLSMHKMYICIQHIYRLLSCGM